MNKSVELKGIQEVADLLSVTPRTLRFYEEKGLIRPLRIGAIRVYRQCEIFRIRLILRGKLMGFSLAETAEFLDLYATDLRHSEEVSTLTGKIRRRITALRRQREAIDQTLEELGALEDAAMKRLRSLEDGEKGAPTSIAEGTKRTESRRTLSKESSAAHEIQPNQQ